MIKFVYFSYVLFFACLLLTNEFFLAYQSFWLFTAPMALVPIELVGGREHRGMSRHTIILSWSNPIRTVSSAYSWVFFWTMMFGTFLVFSTAITPNFSAEWLLSLLIYFISVGLFILITARLSKEISDFYGSFFTILSLIMSLNAAINIFDYFYSLPNISAFSDARLTPGFGVAPMHFPTVAAMTYATGLVAAGGLFVFEICSVRKLIAGVTVVVLFACISLTQSRGPLVGSLVALGVVSCFLTRGSSRPYFLAAPIFLMLSFLLLPKVGAHALARADNHRFEIWGRFFDLALTRPVFGYGERLQINLHISDGESLGHAHNIILSAFMRGGIFGAACLLLSYICSLIYCYRFAVYSRNPIPFGLVIVIMIAGFVDFDQVIFLADWQWISFWLPMGLVVGVESSGRVHNISLRKTLDCPLWKCY